MKNMFGKNHDLSPRELLLAVFGIGSIILVALFATGIIHPFHTPKTQTVVTEKPSDPYPSQKMAVDTPFADPMIVKEPIFPDRICSIDDYGAIADEKTLNTKSFKEAITDCAAKGGGSVVVPAGRWRTGAINLVSNIDLHLNEGATIVFSDNPDHYLPAVFSRYEGIEYYGYSPFIHAIDATNIAVTGKGTIDGQGQLWWPRGRIGDTYALYNMARDDVPVEKRVFATKAALLRPAFIEFTRSHAILIEGITVRNSPFWTIHPLYSSDISIKNISVDTAGVNTDGIAIDSSHDVLIENSLIKSGDDGIVIKSGRDKDGLRVNIPSENIVIRNCQVNIGHGGLSIGSEISGGVRNVFIHDSEFERVDFGLRIKSSVGRGGTVENIWVTNIEVNRLDNTAVQITTNYDDPYDKSYTAVPTIRNVFIEDFSARRSRDSIFIRGLDDRSISNINFKNVSIASRDGIKLTDVDGIHLENVSLEYRYDPFLTIRNGSNVTLKTTPCATSSTACLSVSGEKSGGITIKDSRFDATKTKLAPEVDSSAVTY